MPDTTPTLRDRVRRAICEASGFTWLPDELMEPDEYGEHADAVLAVLRRATQPEIKAATGPVRLVLGTTDQQPTTAESHRLALSEALGLGTGAPWDAIRGRAAELSTELDGTFLHKKNAELRATVDRLRGLLWAKHGTTHREAVEVQPTETEAPATLAALMATIRELQALQQPLVDGLRYIREDMDRAHKSGDEWATEWMGQVWLELPLQVRAAGGDTDAAQELADEAQQPETEAQTSAALLAGRCDACRHTLSKHHNDAGCVIPLCTCGRFQPAADQPDTETEAAK